MKIIITLLLFFSISNSDNLKIDKDICKMFAESEADSYELIVNERKKFIEAKIYLCTIDSYSHIDYENEIILLNKAITLLETIKKAKQDLLIAIKIRAKKNTYKTFINIYYKDEYACWEAIHDYSYLLEYEKKEELYLERAKLYHALGKASKSCDDLYKAKTLGSREARNLLDEYDCS